MRIVVHGLPVPQGSKRVVRGRLIDQNGPGLRSWRQEITDAAIHERIPRRDGPVSVRLDFFFARPAGHFGKRGLRPSAPKAPSVRPDLDKLARAVLDALTGVAYRDDGQVAELIARKHYTDDGPPGLVVEIQPTILLDSERDRQWPLPQSPVTSPAL